MNPIDTFSPMRNAVNRETLRYHVSSAMFCPGCQNVLDVRSAVSVDLMREDRIVRTFIVCTACHDKNSDAARQAAESRGMRLEVLDGRELFGGRH